MTQRRALRDAPVTLDGLMKAHPDAHCELVHDGPFQLLVATVLSAQSTDVGVNKVTPELFRRWPTPQRLGDANVADVEAVLSSLGMFRQKAKNVTGLARAIGSEHGGRVPESLEALVALPGVGRKTANVVLGVAFGAPEGVVVDTHVQRISQRLGWTRNATPEKIEEDLVRLFPRKHWDAISHTLIFHGRRICTARSPACESCPVRTTCPSAFRAEHVGRKPPKNRGGVEAATGRRTAKKHSKKKKSKNKKAAAPSPKARGKKAARMRAAKKAATSKAKS